MPRRAYGFKLPTLPKPMPVTVWCMKCGQSAPPSQTRLLKATWPRTGSTELAAVCLTCHVAIAREVGDETCVVDAVGA